MKHSAFRIAVIFFLMSSFALFGCQKAAESQTKEEKKAKKEKSEMTKAVHKSESEDRATTSLQVGEKSISVNYGTPVWGEKDRLSAAPDGFVWRLGKNEATQIKTNTDLTFGETTIPAGEYSLALRHVSGENWELLVNKETGQWGGPKKRDMDVAAIPMTMSEKEEKTSKMKIDMAMKDSGKGKLKILWGPYVVKTGFAVMAEK